MLVPNWSSVAANAQGNRLLYELDAAFDRATHEQDMRLIVHDPARH